MSKETACTLQEIALIRFLAQGLTPEEVAQKWCLSSSRIRNIAFWMRAHLGARTNEQAMVIAERRGLLRGIIASHGDMAAVRMHERYRLPLCDDCKAAKNGLSAPPVFTRRNPPPAIEWVKGPGGIMRQKGK